MHLNSRLRSWPLIVGALIVVFGIGVGVGVVLAHGQTSANSSATQVARIRAQQQALDSAKSAQVAQQAQTRAQRMQQIAEQQRNLAVRAGRQAESVQHLQQQECNVVYPVPSKTNPKWAADSALQASCIAAVRNGISLGKFRSNRGP